MVYAHQHSGKVLSVFSDPKPAMQYDLYECYDDNPHCQPEAPVSTFEDC
ncbi:hypothetical protein [Methanocalculus taiwanensis]|nr:hypothetical protein [Methanocalculus taiwanensis]